MVANVSIVSFDCDGLQTVATDGILPKLFRDGMTAGRSSTGSPLASTLRTRSKPKQCKLKERHDFLRPRRSQVWASTLLILPLGTAPLLLFSTVSLAFPPTTSERFEVGPVRCIPMIAKECWITSMKSFERRSSSTANIGSSATATSRCGGFDGRGRLQFNEAGQPVSMLGTVQDITERKLAEEALQESEERFRLLVEAVPQPIWRSDADGNVIEVNRRWYEYTGQTAEEAKGSGWTKALHSDEAAMVVKKVREGVTSGAAIEIVNRLRRASDGSYRWHLARAVPMNDRGGKIIGWFGCATDIDDQKRAEEALKQSEEALRNAHDELEQRIKERTAELAKANERLRQANDELRTLYDGMPDGLLAADIKTKTFVRCNASMQRMLGYSKNELLSRSVMDIHPANELPSVLETFHALVDGRQRVGHDIPMLRKDGSVFHADVTHNEIELDGRRCTVGFFRDTSERKRAEEALRQSHDELKAIYDGMADGLHILNLVTRKAVQSATPDESSG